MKLSELGEVELLKRLARYMTAEADTLHLGMGDDAAVVTPGEGLLVLKVDALVEGRHFDFALSRPAAVGARALLRPLSDLAAVAAVPRYALIALLAPPDAEVEVIEALYAGLAAAAERFGVLLVGGETSAASELSLVVTLTGTSAPSAGKGRSRAAAQDEIWVSGFLGDAAAGLAVLQAGGVDKLAEEFGLAAEERRQLASCVARYEAPEPRLALGAALGELEAVHAVMDISDGLALDLHRLLLASGACAEIEPGRLPLSPGCRLAARLLSREAAAFALSGGDDYELLFCAAAGAALPHKVMDLTRLGTVLGCTGETGRIFAQGAAPLAPAGWQHFVA